MRFLRIYIKIFLEKNEKEKVKEEGRRRQNQTKGK
jgi:hypothetical protein